MAELITIPGVKARYVAGLSWRHEDEVPSSRDLANLSRFNGRWGAVRRTASDAVQVGFCEPIDDVKPGQLRVLGAIIAEQQPQPWLGLFQIDEDRYWLIAVSNGHEIIPNGDYVGTLNDVLRVREQHQALRDWTPFEGDLSALAEMVSESARPLVLRDLQRKPWATAAWAAGAVAGIALVAGGVLAWHHHQVAVQEKAERDRQAAIDAALQARRNAEANVLPWTREPVPSEVVDACNRAWSIQALSSGSWTLDSWTCSAGRDGITVADDWTGGRAEDAPGPLTKDAKASGTGSRYPVPFTMGSPHAVLEADAFRAMWIFAQNYGFAVTLQGSSEKPVLPGADPDKSAKSAWTRNTIVLSFDIPPWMGWGSEIDTLPGARIQSIAWSGSATHTSSSKKDPAANNGAGRWHATLSLYTLNLPGTPSKALPRTTHHHAKKANG